MYTLSRLVAMDVAAAAKEATGRAHSIALRTRKRHLFLVCQSTLELRRWAQAIHPAVQDAMERKERRKATRRKRTKSRAIGALSGSKAKAKR